MHDDISPGVTVEQPEGSTPDELDTTANPADGSAPEAEPKKKKKDKDGEPGSNRGIETLFRAFYQKNIQLVQLADNKANTLVGINGMIISVIIALVSPRIEENTWLMAPSVVLLFGCLASLAMAILASRPRLLTSDINLELVLNNDANILFFGDFTRLPVSEFLIGMDQLMQNRRLLYDNMMRDLYSMGWVLSRKYHFLTYAYNTFLATLVLAAAVFVTVFYLLSP